MIKPTRSVSPRKITRPKPSRRAREVNAYLEKTYAAKALRDFEVLYGDRSPQDRSAADRMIDFLVTHGSSVQVGEGGFLTTLLGRLNDVLSLPA